MSIVLAALGFLKNLFGFGEKVTAEIHDANKEADGVAKQDAADKTKALKDAEIAQIMRDRNAGLSHDELVARLRAGGQG